MSHRNGIGSGSGKLSPYADTSLMRQAPGELGIWRWAFVGVGLVSLLMVGLPAEAGLGELVDDLLDPAEDAPVVGGIVEPIAEGVVDPIVEDSAEPVAGDLVDPVVDETLTPIVTTVVPPTVDDDATPVPDIEVAPVAEIPPVGTTTTTTFRVIESDPEEAAGVSGRVGPTPSRYPGGALVADTAAARGELIAVRSTTPLMSLETALALQTTLVDRTGTRYSDPDVDQPAPTDRVEGWLNGLTNWLRTSTDRLVNILALPIRLLELLTRALLTAGSGLIAPLSTLLAFTAFLIKDRRWVSPAT